MLRFVQQGVECQDSTRVPVVYGSGTYLTQLERFSPTPVCLKWQLYTRIFVYLLYTRLQFTVATSTCTVLESRDIYGDHHDTNQHDVVSPLSRALSPCSLPPYGVHQQAQLQQQRLLQLLRRVAETRRPRASAAERRVLAVRIARLVR